MPKVQIKTCLVILVVICLSGVILWKSLLNNQIQYSNVFLPFLSQKGTIEANSISTRNDSYDDLYIITYADEGYFTAIKNFIGSVHYWEPELRIIVYNLGMTKDHLEEVKTWKNIQLFEFNFSLYPPHFTSMHKYAWKLIILNETFHKYEYIFMEDAGQEFRNNIDPVRKIIQEAGFFTTASSGVEGAKKFTSPLMAEYLGIEIESGQLSSGIVGMKKEHPQKENLTEYLHDAVLCSLKEECIAPEGSSLANHRYDQAILSLLAQKYNFVFGGVGDSWTDGDGISHPPVTEDPRKTNDVVLLSRRNAGQAYTEFLVRE